MKAPRSADLRFEAAADAIVRGYAQKLKRLLGAHPELVHARSAREHGATLLHYVSANGVEDERQRTPKNIVEITTILLDAGADIEATANVYGGGCRVLDLTATSVHPERAGVQEAMLQTLLDHGADINAGPIVNGSLGNNRPKAAAFLAAHGARVDFAGAAGLGDLKTVRTLIARATRKKLHEGFLYACRYGHDRVVEFLFRKGANIKARDRNRQTGLHWAVIGGHLDTVKFLLRHKAPLERKNIYGGTVVGQALWSQAHGGDPKVYRAILKALAAAGARIRSREQP